MNLWKLILGTALVLIAALALTTSSFASQVEHAQPTVETAKLESRYGMELVGSSNFTDPMTFTKRQNGYGRLQKRKPPRDSKIYMDEYDRDHYLDTDGVKSGAAVLVKDQESNGGSSSSHIYRSNYHSTDYNNAAGGRYSGPGFPATGYAPGLSPGGAGFGPGPGGNFGWGGLGAVGNGGGGHAVGHSFHVFDPIFLMITLSFILFLVNSILGIVDRYKLPVVFARSGDVPIQSDLGLEIVDGLINEIRHSLDRYVEKEK